MIRKAGYKFREWRYNIADTLGFPLRFKGREGEVQIIIFHGICEDHHQLINGRFMHLSRYRELLKALKLHFNILSYADFLTGKIHPEKLNVLITFDDGYRNFLTLGLPVLHQLELPAVLFVNDPEEQANWSDLFDIATAHLTDSHTFLKKIIPFDVPENRNGWRRWLKLQNAQTILQFIKALKLALPPQLLEKYAVFHELLSDAELVEIYRSGLVTLGNHGANHLHYPSVSEAEREQDVRKVTDRLQRISCVNPPFAFPYGGNDASSVRNLEAWGYTHQFVTENASVSGLYPRITLHPLFSVGNQLRFIHRGKF